LPETTGRDIIPGMVIIVNGKEMQAGEGLTVTGLFKELGLSDKRVAVELNRVILRREEYDERVVLEGDIIEIISFVGGG